MVGDADADADLGPDADRDTDPDADPERTRLGGAAALLAAGGFVYLAGLPGLVAGLAVLAGWYLLGGTYAFALGQLGVASTLTGVSVIEFVAVEVGLLGVLLAPAIALDRSDWRSSESTVLGYGPSFAFGPALLALAWVLAGGALAWAVTRSLAGTSVAGVVLVTASALAAYGLARYQFVSLARAGGGGE